ncbi:MAG TPA: argininosuccinate lyase, partial [Candidatus Aphodousia faecigallinarum]|nr:argininosuccinate lyase [Candidatus Aphodousia faecigallinarum]
ANLVVTRAHNVPSGMIDGKSVKVHAALAQESVKTMERFVKIIKAFVVNKDRALEELSLDWTASQEIADRLMSEYGLPFRVGHHVASGMVSFARANGILPLTFPYSEMKRIYAETVQKEMPGLSTDCPMSEEEFKASLDPREILKRRRTEGSANHEEVSRMLAELTSEMAILKEQTTMLAAAIDQSMADLDSQFEPFLQTIETK